MKILGQRKLSFFKIVMFIAILSPFTTKAENEYAPYDYDNENKLISVKELLESREKQIPTSKVQFKSDYIEDELIVKLSLKQICIISYESTYNIKSFEIQKSPDFGTLEWLSIGFGASVLLIGTGVLIDAPNVPLQNDKNFTNPLSRNDVLAIGSLSAGAGLALTTYGLVKGLIIGKEEKVLVSEKKHSIREPSYQEDICSESNISFSKAVFYILGERSYEAEIIDGVVNYPLPQNISFLQLSLNPELEIELIPGDERIDNLVHKFPLTKVRGIHNYFSQIAMIEINKSISQGKYDEALYLISQAESLIEDNDYTAFVEKIKKLRALTSQEELKARIDYLLSAYSVISPQQEYFLLENIYSLMIQFQEKYQRNKSKFLSLEHKKAINDAYLQKLSSNIKNDYLSALSYAKKDDRVNEFLTLMRIISLCGQLQLTYKLNKSEQESCNYSQERLKTIQEKDFPKRQKLNTCIQKCNEKPDAQFDACMRISAVLHHTDSDLYEKYVDVCKQSSINSCVKNCLR